MKKTLHVHPMKNSACFSRGVFILAFLLSLCFSSSYANNARYGNENQAKQSKKIIKGRVTDDTGEPLIGATVVIKGTTKGSITNIDGEYELEIDDNAQTLVFSFIGLETKEVEIAGQTVINIQLLPDTKEIDAVVVTALGIKKREKTLGYAMEVVTNEDLPENRSLDITTALQGKVAGLHINSTGTGEGGSTFMLLRGVNSLQENKNKPLWVVDGVPISDGDQGSGNQFGDIDYAGGATDINMDDIESVSVLKGANAAALYGSSGQNGVILITTKKGKKKEGLSVSYSGNFTLTDIYDSHETQNEYGQGSNGVYSNPEIKSSWGRSLATDTTVEHWRKYWYQDSITFGKTNTITKQPDRVENFFRNGSSKTHNFSVSGGNEVSTFHLSFMNQQIEGITKKHKIEKNNINLNTGTQIDKLEINLKLNYIRTKGARRPNTGRSSAMYHLMRIPVGLDMSHLIPAVDTNLDPINWIGNDPGYSNPYHIINYGSNRWDRTDRVLGVLNMVYSATPWLKINFKNGIDYRFIKRENYGYPNREVSKGRYEHFQARNKKENNELIIMLNKTYGQFELSSNLGAGRSYSKDINIKGITDGPFIIPEVFTLANGPNGINAEEDYTESETHSLYGTAQIGFRDFIFLDITARNDWSSTLQKKEWSFFYPSVSLSAVISDMFVMPGWITFIKARGSYAEVGNATDAYKVYSNYTQSEMYGHVIGTQVPGEKKLPLYQPEHTISKEGGIDLRFFQNRLGIDFTWYKTNTYNQIIPYDPPQVGGYGSALANSGNVQTEGYEFMVNAVPLKFKDFEWSLDVNYSETKNKIIELYEHSPYKKMSEIFNMAEVRTYENGSFGDLYGPKLMRTSDGKFLIDPKTYLPIPLREPDNYEKLGNIMPEWIGAVTNTFKFKGISVSALINVRMGGIIFSVTDSYLSKLGMTPRTLKYRDGGMVIDGYIAQRDPDAVGGWSPAVDADSNWIPNTNETNAQAYWDALSGEKGASELFIYDASYIKLGQVSLGYKLPSKWLDKIFIQQFKLSLVGSNLLYLQKHTPGNPEGAFNRKEASQGFELASMPAARTYGINVQVKF